jgi:hypothetical protein
MLDLDPGLDARLRALFDQIESDALTSPLTVFDPAPKRKGRRTINLFAGALAIAVVAASVAAFAIELSSHHDGPSPNPSQHSAATPTPEPTPSPVALPPLGGSALPVDSQVLIPVTEETGSATLPTFTPTEPFYIQIAGIGSGPFDIQSADGSFRNMQYGSWSGGVETISPSGPGEVLDRPLSLHVTAPGMTWEILIVESGMPTPAAVSKPGGLQIPVGAEVLLPTTQGTGPATLPAFTPTGPFYVVFACSGSGGLDIVTATGAPVGGSSPCPGLNSTGGIGSDATQPSKPESWSIEVQPSTTWKILIYQDAPAAKP